MKSAKFYGFKLFHVNEKARFYSLDVLLFVCFFFFFLIKRGKNRLRGMVFSSSASDGWKRE
jgi:hypothetical protein